MRVATRFVLQILIVATGSPMEDVFGSAFVVVAMLITLGMHCSGNGGAHGCISEFRK